jgi:hypothetical protein
MFIYQEVIPVDDEYFRLLAVIVVAILAVSLLINALLAADPGLVKGPPVRIHGFIGADGSPAAGYYTAATVAQPADGTSAVTLSLAAPPVP